MPNSVRPHRQQPTRLPRPWDSPGKNTGVGCHFLLQCMKVKSESEVAQSCPTLSDPTDCSLPGSSHGIFQVRVLEWVAIAFSYEILNVYCFQKLSFGVNLLCSNGDLIERSCYPQPWKTKSVSTLWTVLSWHHWGGKLNQQWHRAEE